MKHRFTRFLSSLLILCILVTMLAGLQLPASAASYSYNNGKKGVLCTALSSSAKAYYGTGYEYETLSKLSGTTLEAKLKARMENGWQGNSYDALKSYFKYTDAYNGSSSSVYCFYSNSSVTSWNREHVWPQSKSQGRWDTGSFSAGSDVIHLRPTDNKANSTRSSLPYGEVTGGTYQNVTTSAGKLAGYYSPAFYEPLDSVKGDIARTLMYVYTRWDQRNLTDVIDSIDLLLKWCEEDPVDEYEMKRNDICQEICGSRNIYVDYPEYCWRVFNKAIPTHMKTPSGKGNTCNNPQYVGVETKAATCTGNGTMTYTCKNCGYAYTEVIPSHGHHYVNGTCEFCGAKQAEIQYFRVDTLTAGDEIVIFNPSNKKVISTTATTYTKNGVVYDRLQGASATVAGTELTTTAKDVAIFKVEKSGSNYAFKLEDGRYLTCETSEFLTLTASPKSGTNKWTLEDSGTDGWYIKNTTTYYQDYQKNYAYIEYYYTFTTYGFKGTAGQAAYNMNFYKVVRAAQCAHDYQVTATKAATCTEKGYTSYLCSKCGDAYTTYTDPLGHDYQIETVDPTEIEQGYDLHTCSRCGDTYKDNYTDPVVIGDPCEGYTDIDRRSWYHDAADFVILRKIMGSTQTESLTFEPATACTRSMIVSILYRLSESPEVTFEDRFPDVQENQWFASAVIWAYQNEIVKGYDTGLFGPNDKITREQMAVILKAYTEKTTDKDTSGRANLADFPDEGDVTWARDAVRWAVSENLISGKSNDGQLLLDPQGSATRAEVASILMRFIEGLK